MPGPDAVSALLSEAHLGSDAAVGPAVPPHVHRLGAFSETVATMAGQSAALGVAMTPLHTEALVHAARVLHAFRVTDPADALRVVHRVYPFTLVCVRVCVCAEGGRGRTMCCSKLGCICLLLFGVRVFCVVVVVVVVVCVCGGGGVEDSGSCSPTLPRLRCPLLLCAMFVGFRCQS